MADMPLNLIPNDPSLKDLLDQFGKGLLLNLNCHAIGQIQVFDPETQQATATIVYKKTFFQPDKLTGEYLPTLVDYPILVDCPVMCLGGGDGALTFPIAPGDECLVLFNDRDIDNWFNGATGSGVNTPRLHSFADGIILVGVRSLANVIVDYNATGVELRNKLGSAKITIEPNGDITLTTIFGFFTFKADSDIHFNTGTVEGLIGHGGHVKFKNAAGEYTAANLQLFTDIQTGLDSMGLPLTMPTFATDLIIAQSFKEP
jgi:hypothetical protein